MANENFPPVDYLSILEPFQSPQNIPGNPHNLPAVGVRPRRMYGPGGLELVGGATTVVSQPGAPSSGPVNQFNVQLVSDPHHYANVISALLNPVSILAANPVFLDAPANKRNMLVLRNASTGTQNIYLDFGKAASAFSPIKLTPGQIILFDTVVPQDDLYAFGDAASAVLAYGYSTIAGNL